eukprot:TRINITY_DN2116_c0_g1_i1.p1 TRINITY_DN2116_c0_g1~~TRINITY_DN2116_c0_g1_i1.p1  ORF type:complete len:153 (-),score=8.41 TRINITY_DN2116_c0_g1_i1:56-514(-)
MASKKVIGCFINTLVLRVYLEDRFNFDKFLTIVSNVCNEAFDHQCLPFDYLVRQLNVARDTSTTPVFSVNVCYHNTEMKSEHIIPPGKIILERKLLHNNSCKWDMQFDFLQEQEGMRFTYEYYCGIISDQYAECVVENFLFLVKAYNIDNNR